MVRLSVIMPVYNAERFLQPALDSVLRQNAVRELELICVDDGSTDGSPAILEKTAAEDARVTVLHTAHGGPGAARNAGIAAAKGAYIAFLDADDVLNAEALRTALCKAEADAPDILLCASRTIDENGSVTETRGVALHPHRLPQLPPVFSGRELGGALFAVGAVVWARLFRADFLKDRGIAFPPLFRTEDVCFLFPALYLANRISVLDIPLVDYRHCPANPSLERTKELDPLAFWNACVVLSETMRTCGADGAVMTACRLYVLDQIRYNLKRIDTAAGFRAIRERMPAMLAEVGFSEEEKEAMSPRDRALIALADLPWEDALTVALCERREEIFLQQRRTAKAEERARILEHSKAYRLGSLLLCVPKRIRSLLTRGGKR
ncbi:MAG: glycosyltransferase [Clostridia bacterium]|nr:glycosyltransferase [Clostridia bacterium]